MFSLFVCLFVFDKNGGRGRKTSGEGQSEAGGSTASLWFGLTVSFSHHVTFFFLLPCSRKWAHGPDNLLNQSLSCWLSRWKSSVIMTASPNTWIDSLFYNKSLIYYKINIIWDLSFPVVAGVTTESQFWAVWVRVSQWRHFIQQHVSARFMERPRCARKQLMWATHGGQPQSGDLFPHKHRD